MPIVSMRCYTEEGHLWQLGHIEMVLCEIGFLGQAAD
jgi:hypothetical protein